MLSPISPTPQAVRRCSARARGFSVIELLVALGLFGVLAGIAISNTKSTRLQVATAQNQLVAQLRLARIKAITTVSHYSISFTSTTQFKVYAMTNNGTWQLAATPSNTVTLPSVVSFPSALVGSRIEFNSRGMMVSSTAVIQITLNDVFGQTRTVQAWPSGQVYAV